MPTAPESHAPAARMSGLMRRAAIRPRHCLSVLVALGAAACSSEGPEPQGETPADTGVVVMENLAPTWSAGEAWTVGSAPSIDITALADDPTQLLEFVRGAARLGDGRIVISNGATNELRTYGPDGQFMFTRGGFGQAPDEFRQIGEVVAFGNDSVAVNDWGSSRVVVYKPSAEWARDFALPDLGPAYVPLLQGRFADGTLLVGTGDRIDPATTQLGVVRKPVIYVHASAEGAVLDTIGEFSGDELFVAARGARSIQAQPLPFGRTTAATIAGNLVHVGSSDDFEIQALTPAGELRQVVRMQRSDVPVTVESFRILADQRVARIEDEAVRAERRQELLDMPIPETMPAFGLILGDSEGYLWVQDFAAPDALQVDWNVFAPDGTLLGAVRLPAKLRVKQIDSDGILGVLIDDLGIEHVQLYPLTRG